MTQRGNLNFIHHLENLIKYRKIIIFGSQIEKKFMALLLLEILSIIIRAHLYPKIHLSRDFFPKTNYPSNAWNSFEKKKPNSRIFFVCLPLKYDRILIDGKML